MSMTEEKIGVIHHYFSKVGVAAIKITSGRLSVGDHIRIVGAHTDFTQPVIDFLGKHPILLMTGWDLYCMVRDVFEEKRSQEEVIDILYDTVGKLEYPISGSE
jgi:predicted ABC-class ATPase